LLPRRIANPGVPADESADDFADDYADDGTLTAPKGRPTPKRRDSEPRRGPVSAPKTRKEAVQRQRQQTKRSRSAPTTQRERRQRILSGDPSALPRRDQGPARALARDYVDSRRMVSNFLLLLFPLIFLSFFFRTSVINIVVLALFVFVLGEWYLTGRKIFELARAHGIDTKGERPFGLGFYGGTRAYLPRNWRVPRPRVELGDEI
jgi:hypothetical protein